MRFLSVCSGIEAASVAWNPLGWKASAFSEIEPFPSAVLAHHYPTVPNLGDMTAFKDWPDAAIDLLCGGTPCQSFSNAGLRAGLDDPRGQLMLTFGAIAARYRPRWLVWENVPGVLSSNGGRDFGAFLGLLGFLGYGFAYRVLDAQFVRVDGYARAVPQRRQRVFVVGCLGDWRSAAAVLLERESLRGDLAPRRSSRQGSAIGVIKGAAIGRKPEAGPQYGDSISDGSCYTLTTNETHAVAMRSMCEPCSRFFSRFRCNAPEECDCPRCQGYCRCASEYGSSIVSMCLNAKGGGGRLDGESETLIPTNGGVFDDALPFDTTQVTSSANRSNPKRGDPCHPLVACGHAPAIAFDARQSDVLQYGEKTGPLDTDGCSTGILTATAVRRLMPLECERLQGFEDSYTAITYRGKPAADGPRYKAIGNSWAIPPVRWIGKRIDIVEGVRR